MDFTFNTSIPAASDNPSTDQPLMLQNNVATAGIIAVDHVGFNTTGGGQHAQVTFNANNVPTPPVSPPVLFTNTVAGLPQLFFYSGDATHSSNQSSPSTIGSNGSILLMGGLILKWGIASGPSVTYTSLSPALAAFPNNCFSVLVTGTVFFSGTPVVTGTPSTTGFTVSSSATFYFLAIGN